MKTGYYDPSFWSCEECLLVVRGNESTRDGRDYRGEREVLNAASRSEVLKTDTP